jgi:hypothetical protein
MKVAVCAALVCMLLAPGFSGAPPAPDPLTQFNAAFRETYARVKADSLTRGAVLMVSGDELLLYRNGAETARATIRPALYHRFKAVAHVPLALHLLLGQGGGTREQILGLRALAAAARAGLGTWAPPPALAGQEQILDGCLRLMDERLAPGGLAPGRLDAFAAAMGPLVLASADWAAALELEALHRQVARYRNDIPAGEWADLRVVVIGAHMARDGEVAMQYFQRLLGEAGEGSRIVYAEGLWQPRDAMDLLATHRVDLGEGAAFFGEPMRMHRDILADGARKWLDGHLPAVKRAD